MADRLAVMNEGRIEQVGSPREVYEEPASATSLTSSASRTCSTRRPLARIPTAGAGSGSETSSCSPPVVTPRPGGRSGWSCARNGYV